MAKGPKRDDKRRAEVPSRPAPTTVAAAAPPANESVLLDLLHLFGLAAFAVAQPVFDLLGRNAEFFVARRSPPADIAAFVLLIGVAVPALLALLELAVHVVSPRARQALHLGLVALLVAATALPAMKRLTDASAVAVPTALLVGAGAAAIARRSVVRTFLSLLIPAPAVFGGLFLFASPVAHVLAGGGGAAFNVAIGNPVPVVMVVFDEFSQISLLDENQGIDAARYPNFAALARQSTWYRNGTTVSYHTELAVPSLLSGIYPEKKRLQTVADYPNNLFTLLGGTYDMVVHEAVTRLCPHEVCGAGIRPPFADRLRSLVADVGVVYLHILLPRDLEGWLPSVSDRWEGFAFSGARPTPHRADEKVPSLEALVQGDRLAPFNDFLASMHPSPRPTLYFLHLILPHSTWRYLPSGKDYSTFGSDPMMTGCGAHGVWGDDEWLVMQGFQRYLLQVGFADQLLGRLVARMKEVGLYDDALFVVVADHGVSTVANEARRGVSPTGYPELLLVPFFIKTPHQRDGAINDRNVQLIDLLPTIASILKVELPFPVDGASALDAAAPEPTEKRLIVEEPPPHIYDSQLKARRWNLDRQLALFGTGTTRPDGLYRIGPHSELLGHAVTAADREPALGVRVRVDMPDVFLDVHPDGAFIPAYISGRLGLRQVSEPLNLAIAVNDVIAAVTRTHHSPYDDARFAAIAPESAFKRGDNDVQVYVISEVDGRVQLRRAEPFPSS